MNTRPFKQKLRGVPHAWAFSTADYSLGIMFSYILFVSIFGSLFSISSLISTGTEGLTNSLILVSLLLKLFFISYFAAFLGPAFKFLLKGSNKDKVVKRVKIGTSLLLVGACIWGVISFRGDRSLLLSLITFTCILLAVLLQEDKKSYPTNSSMNASRAFRLLYGVYMIVNFLISPDLDILASLDNHYELLIFLTGPFVNIQMVSLSFAAVTTPLALGLAHRDRPHVAWFICFSSVLLSFGMIYFKLYTNSFFLLCLTALLLYKYLANPPMDNPITTQIERRATSDLGTRMFDSVMQKIVKPLEKLAREVEFFREEKTGEILRVEKVDSYIPDLEREVVVNMREKKIGVKHYVIVSRTGHGKTSLMQNLMKVYKDFSFLVLDRHSEYDDGKIIDCDKVFNIEALRDIISQIPTSRLSEDKNLLREAQIHSLEQQFNTVLKDLVSEKIVSEIFKLLLFGQNVILRQNSMPDIIYTYVSHILIKRIFENKMKYKAKRIVIVNEEAQNSFDTNEDGKETNKGHVLLQVICEGRKYGISLINMTSNPDAIPMNVKDNSTLIIGSIGTPAIKKLVGEKLGMIYVRFISEQPVGQFFIDEVNETGNYITFSNLFAKKGKEIDAVPSFIR